GRGGRGGAGTADQCAGADEASGGGCWSPDAEWRQRARRGAETPRSLDAWPAPVARRRRGAQPDAWSRRRREPVRRPGFRLVPGRAGPRAAHPPGPRPGERHAGGPAARDPAAGPRAGRAARPSPWPRSRPPRPRPRPPPGAPGRRSAGPARARPRAALLPPAAAPPGARADAAYPVEAAQAAAYPDPGAIAVARGLARREADGSVVFRPPTADGPS